MQAESRPARIKERQAIFSLPYSARDIRVRRAVRSVWADIHADAESPGPCVCQVSTAPAVNTRDRATSVGPFTPQGLPRPPNGVARPPATGRISRICVQRPGSPLQNSGSNFQGCEKHFGAVSKSVEAPCRCSIFRSSFPPGAGRCRATFGTLHRQPGLPVDVQ